MRSVPLIRCLPKMSVAIVVDFHWFTDCYLEAIFNMNTSRVQLRSSITVDGKLVEIVNVQTSVVDLSKINKLCG